MPNGIGEKGEERICGNLDLRKRECAKGEKKMEFCFAANVVLF